MAEDVISIGIALDTSKVLAGAKQVDTALKQVASSSTTTAQATKQIDAAAKTAGQAMTGESAAAQAVTNALRQEAQASGTAASQTEQVSRAAQAAAAALQKESQAATQAAAAIDKTGQAAGTSTGLLQRLGSSMGAIGQQAASFAVAQVGVQSLEQALSSVVGFLSSSVRAAVQTESLTAAFKAIEGSGQAAGKTMQFLKDTANRLGVDVVALSTGFKTIDAASRGTSLQGEQIRKIFVAMSEASRVLGLSGQDLNGVLLAVGQSISKGSVQAEELRGQIGERLPGAFQIAARAMGVTTAELDKMMERGELQATTFWPRFAETIKKEFGGSVEEAAKTAGAAFERFHNTMREFQVNVGQLVIPPLQWIIDKANAAAGALNKTAQAIKDVGKAERDAAAESQRLAGGKDVATKLQAERNAAVAEEAAARAARQGAGAIAGQGSPQYAAAQERENAAIAKRIELDRQLATAAKAAQRAGDPLGEGAEVEPGARDERLVEFQKKLTDQTKANRDELEKLDRVTQQLYGRKPTEDEILKVKEKQVDATKKLIDTSQELWNRSKDTAPAKELRAQAAGAEALEKSIKAAAEAEREGKKDAKEAEREEERARKEALDATMAKGKAIYEQDQDVVDLLGEMQKRTQSLQSTEEERFAARVKAMAEEHPAAKQLLEDELARYSAARDVNEALKQRNKLLGEEAQVSAGALSDIQRLQKQLEPRRRDLSRAEQHEAILADLSKASKGDPDTLRWAREQSVRTLALEESMDLWKRWEEVGLSALDHVASAIEEFVFKGKLNFKDMMGAIAQDLFRFATQTLMQSATKQGGWLEAGLNLGLKALGIASGFGGMNAATTANVQAGLTTNLIGNPELFQHGGEAFAGRPYIVGEAGPELFVPRTSGTVLPHGQGVASPTVVNVHVSGVQDAQSFVQSRGAVSRAMMGALSQARQQM